MKKHKNVSVAVCTAFISFCCLLSGCSVSFCGLQAGGKKEMVFSCNGELPAQENVPLTADAGESGPVETPGEGDGERVPAAASEEESGKTQESPVSSAPQKADSDGRVDLNSASLEELTTLNGIGESRAKAIIEYRSQQGPFTRIEDIMQVSGIKEGVFSKIQDQIVVR